MFLGASLKAFAFLEIIISRSLILCSCRPLQARPCPKSAAQSTHSPLAHALQLPTAGIAG